MAEVSFVPAGDRARAGRAGRGGEGRRDRPAR